MTKVVLVQIAILAVGAALFEIGLRIFLPLPAHGGIYLDDQGRSVRVSADAVVLKSDLRVTHVASEFTKTVTTNHFGYRVTPGDDSTEPDYLFLGDSFAFGHGVSDNEVGVFKFCAARKVRCQNLGRSGTDTFDQAAVLRHALDARAFKPKVVVIIMFVSCWLRGSGNDLAGNLEHAGPRAEAFPFVRAGFSLSFNDFAKTLQAFVTNFEITKRAMIVLAGPLKSGAFTCSSPDALRAAAQSTRVALDEIAAMAGRAHFTVKILSVNPYQELGGHYTTTEAAVRSALPAGFAYFPTASRFKPEQYYPYDGHLNAAGQANLAAIMNEVL